MSSIELIPIACVVIALIVNLAVQVEKKIVPDFPDNLLTAITATVLTILAFIAYMSTAAIPFTFAYVVACLVGCIIESYIAMFGYDKFIQTIRQYKDYLNKTKQDEE